MRHFAHGVWKSFVVATGVVILMAAPLLALDIPPAPPLDRPIVDQTGTLSETDITELSQAISASEKDKDYQIGILMIPTLGKDEYLERYSIKVARQWGVGMKAKDNGVLILVVKDDHRMRIEVGRGLEGDLTDIKSDQIIREVAAPEFRKDDYAKGLLLTTQSVAAQVEGKPDPNLPSSEVAVSEAIEMVIIYGFFAVMPLGMWLISIMGRTKSWWLGGVLGVLGGGIIPLFAGISLPVILAWIGIAAGGFLLDYVVSRNYKQNIRRGRSPSWWAGGPWVGGGSGGSGGFGGGSGFGGGGFGGGGASGGW